MPGRSLTGLNIGVEPISDLRSCFAPTDPDHATNEDILTNPNHPTNIPVGAKHDRNKFKLKTDNLYTVMLRPFLA
jgi:hypothetical protein